MMNSQEDKINWFASGNMVHRKSNLKQVAGKLNQAENKVSQETGNTKTDRNNSNLTLERLVREKWTGNFSNEKFPVLFYQGINPAGRVISERNSCAL